MGAFNMLLVVLGCAQLASAVTVEDVLAQQKPLVAQFQNVKFEFERKQLERHISQGSVQLGVDGTISKFVQTIPTRNGTPTKINWFFMRTPKGLTSSSNSSSYAEFVNGKGSLTQEAKSMSEILDVVAPENIFEFIQGDIQQTRELQGLKWTVSEPEGNTITVQCLTPRPNEWSGRRWILDITKNFRVVKAESLNRSVLPYHTTLITYDENDYPTTLSVDNSFEKGIVVTTMKNWTRVESVDFDIVNSMADGEYLTRFMPDGSGVDFKKVKGELECIMTRPVPTPEPVKGEAPQRR